MNIKPVCTPPCAAAPAYELPGTDLFAQMAAENAGGSPSSPIYVSTADRDTNWTPTPVQVTSATPNQWVELMPANIARTGGFIQSKAASGSIYIMPYDTGFPANGTQPGEIEVPPRPSFYGFDVEPDRRWIVRGDTASLAFSAATW